MGDVSAEELERMKDHIISTHDKIDEGESDELI